MIKLRFIILIKITRWNDFIMVYLKYRKVKIEKIGQLLKGVGSFAHFTRDRLYFASATWAF